jgi:hypothetical protein
MTPKMLALLKDLADVLEKHAGGLHYTKADDGIHVTQGGDWTSICIKWPRNGNCQSLRKIIENNS